LSTEGAVSVFCPSCDAEAAADEKVCPKCGAKLVIVRMKDNLLGTVVDNRFEIQKRIGEGGMGTVYQAWQRSIGREVAIKMIDQRVAGDMTAAKRFLREARLASALSHPNTISMIDFGQCDDGRLFIAMELLRGQTLDKVLEGGPLPHDRVLRIAIQICDALVAAHKLQIIHRDLKLENVMLLDDVSRGDFVKVLDFGLAKSLTQSDGHSTRAGIVVGTPQYLTPETMTGAPPTVSNDLYALGVMLGELCSGHQLWSTTDFTELCGQKLQRAPDLADVPEPLRSLIRKLIAPKLEQRPADATAVANELGRMRGASSLAGYAQPPPRPPVPPNVGAFDATQQVPAVHETPRPHLEIQPMAIVEFNQPGPDEHVEFNDVTSGGTPIDIRFRRPRADAAIARTPEGSGEVKPGTGAVAKRRLRERIAERSGLLWTLAGLIVATIATIAIVYAIITPTKHKAPPTPTETR